MDIAISFDKNYLTPFYALITSIFINNSNEKFSFHCIVKNDVTDIEKNKIIEYVNQNGASIKMYNIEDEIVSSFVVSGKWTTSVYYKMFFPILVEKNIKKLIYLDTDMLVVGKLNSLYNTELGDQPLAAVYDNYVKIQPDLGIFEEGNYFNSGMLLYNIPVWNKLNISQKAVDFLTNYPEKIKFVDQCALNGVILGNWIKLSEKFNLIYSYIPQDISQKDLDLFIKDKVVIHFTLQRPWNFLCRNRLRKLYKYYLLKSPAKSNQIINDFSVDKLIPYINLRVKEFYFDNNIIQKIWRFIKM
jgi:lipopolysaccharide biosynthesis glycosyltransferase